MAAPGGGSYKSEADLDAIGWSVAGLALEFLRSLLNGAGQVEILETVTHEGKKTTLRLVDRSTL